MDAPAIPLAPPLPDSLHAAIDGPVAILRLTRPEKRNALDDPTILGIRRFFASIPEGVRSVVVHGAGEHFSAGLDLSELRQRDIMEGIAHSRAWHAALDNVQFGTVPVVAVLHGGVIGGGLELAAAAHIRVAETSTFYALPEGTHGIFVGGGGSVRIPSLIGAARMTDMMLTGRTYTAEEGQQVGLSHYLTDAGEGLTRGIELARRIAAVSDATHFAVMHALPRIAEAGRDHGLFVESLVSAIAQSTPQAKARIERFLSKQTSTRVVKSK